MRWRGLVLSLLGAVAIAAFAQSDLKPEVGFRADTTLVLIPVSVTDSSNRYVLGLDRENFRLLEDNSEQTIAHFSSEDAPLSVGLLVDTSGSMGSKLDISRKAVIEFLKTLNAADEAFLVEFSDRAQLDAPLTHDTREIEKKLATVKSEGLTALLDAVNIGLQQMKEAHNPRKALLIISDGGDNNSRYTSREIEDLVREADVQIFAMGVFEPFLALGLTPAEIGGPRLLAEISEQTGGRALAASSTKELPGIAERIGLELRNQYLLAYSPGNRTKDGKYRHVQVTLLPPKELPPLKARWRTGYYAPSE
jgi:Ca-activated chloride channel family protein